MCGCLSHRQHCPPGGCVRTHASRAGAGRIASRGCEAAVYWLPRYWPPRLRDVDGGIPSNSTRLPSCGWCCVVCQLVVGWFLAAARLKRRRAGRWQFHQGSSMVAVAVAVVSVLVVVVFQSSRDENAK